ncbi:hypothetical protein [Mucilaginibacter sp. SG564]|uniref:hypothetical protein n=1 Tax=Mucilaginibacter sp. SG564 TaxID=2587022 RepID=UPI001556DDDD|nr:hypothetical protein [Mucilaginibacter sp. SG564]
MDESEKIKQESTERGVPPKVEKEKFAKWILTQETIVPYCERTDWRANYGDGHE